MYELKTTLKVCDVTLPQHIINVWTGISSDRLSGHNLLLSWLDEQTHRLFLEDTLLDLLRNAPESVRRAIVVPGLQLILPVLLAIIYVECLELDRLGIIDRFL